MNEIFENELLEIVFSNKKLHPIIKDCFKEEMRKEYSKRKNTNAIKKIINKFENKNMGT